MIHPAAAAALPFYPLPRIQLPFDPADFDRHGPRDYQLDLLLGIVAAIADGHTRILVQLPTGGGKTKLATALLASASWAQFIVHRKELIEQTSRAFWAARLPHSFVAAGKPYDPDAAVLLCGIVTLAEQLGIVLPPNIVIWDEAHHLNAATWAEVMAAYPDAIHIGLTATPQRLDGRGLDEHFDIMLLGPPTRELIARGYLSDFDYYAPPPANDDEAALIGDVVSHYLLRAPGQPGIVFASNRDHGKSITAEFVSQGVRAIFVDGTMTDRQRSAADAMFRSGEAQMFVNVNIAGEGYDVPGVVYCGIARRTKSLSWYLQMVGRALRPVYAPGMPIDTDQQRLAALAAGPKPRAIVCDHGNNLIEHGLPDDDREWTLAGRLRGNGARVTDADPIHQCLVCYRVTHSYVKICPGCDTEFPVKTQNLRIKPGDLVKIDRAAAKAAAAEARKAAERERRREERECKSHADFVSLHQRKGYGGDPHRWASMKMKFRSTWKRP